MFLVGCSLAWLENVIESQMFLHVKLLNTYCRLLLNKDVVLITKMIHRQVWA